MLKNKIAIVCSGGDAPGINNVIYGICKKFLYSSEVIGFIDGFEGIYNKDLISLNWDIIDGIQLEGGSIIGCERFEEFLKIDVQTKIIKNLKELNIEHLIILGGNGTLKAAKILSNKGIKIHFIPTTIDNDVKHVELTLGFDTALNSILEFIRKVNYSAKNHKKVQFYELMGRNCSDLTNYIGQAIFADYIIDNKNFENSNLTSEIATVINNSNKRSNIVLISEKLTNSNEIAKNLSLKIKKRIWFMVIGHFQRGGKPSFNDCRYAFLCVEKIYKNILQNACNIIYSDLGEVDIKCEIE